MYLIVEAVEQGHEYEYCKAVWWAYLRLMSLI